MYSSKGQTYLRHMHFEGQMNTFWSLVLVIHLFGLEVLVLPGCLLRQLGA